MFKHNNKKMKDSLFLSSAFASIRACKKPKMTIFRVSGTTVRMAIAPDQRCGRLQEAKNDYVCGLGVTVWTAIPPYQRFCELQRNQKEL